MRRYRLRRLWRVNCEAVVRAAGQNLKRLLKKRGWSRHPWPQGAENALLFGFFRCFLRCFSKGGRDDSFLLSFPFNRRKSSTESFSTGCILGWLGRCTLADGDLSATEQMYQRAMTVIGKLLKQDPENRDHLHLQATQLADLGDLLLSQGRYADAKAAHEQSLQIKEHLGDLVGQSVSRVGLGAIALEQGVYAEAQQRYQQALTTFQTLGEPASEAILWHQLGVVAQAQQDWLQAERCFRESLALEEQLRDLVGAARTCNHLGQVAADTDRFEEAKGWYQRSLVLNEQTDVER